MKSPRTIAVATDTIWGYNEPAGALYPGSPGGRHPERLNGNGGCPTTGPCAAAQGSTQISGQPWHSASLR